MVKPPVLRIVSHAVWQGKSPACNACSGRIAYLSTCFRIGSIRNDGGSGFIPAYFFGGLAGGRRRRKEDFGCRISDFGWRWFRLGGFWRDGLGGLLCPGGLQLAEDLVGALVYAGEAGFAAGGKSHRAGVVGHRGVGIREPDDVITAAFPLILLPAAHLGVEDVRFDGLEAEDTPAGGDHLVDQILFRWGGGLVDFHLLLVNRLEVVFVFAFED